MNNESDMHLNLDKIKDTPLAMLEAEDKIALILVLLKQLQPYLQPPPQPMPKRVNK